MPETPRDTPPATDRTGTVIAAPNPPGISGYSGRYLHGASDPGTTAHRLHELITVRYPGKRAAQRATAELITEHPAGWHELGAATAKDPTIKARRAPAPAGTCYCHARDGAWTEIMRKNLDAMLRKAENRAHGGYLEYHDLLPRTRPGDGGPLLISSGNEPKWVEHIYLIRPEALEVKTRDAAYPRTHNAFATIGLVRWDAQVDVGAINRAAETARVRTIAEIADEHAADTFAETARRLEAMPADHGLAMLLLSSHRAYYAVPPEHAPTVLLAGTAGIKASELPSHLEALSRGEQISLLRRAAHQIHPAEHPAA